MKKSSVFYTAAFLSFFGGLEAAPPRSQIDFAIARGLSYLAKAQRPDGSFAGTRYQVASQGLVGLAFLANGHTPRFGPYARMLRVGLRRLLSYQRPDGYFDDGGFSRMYGHGFATLYLSQVIGMWGIPDEEEKIRKALIKAIKLIESSQDQYGGWDYDPYRAGASDCSITVCQAMALRGARNIGIYVDERVVKKALDYVRRAQHPSGGFRYRLSMGRTAGAWVTPGCTAAGVCILNGLGEYDSERVRKGLAFLRRNRGSLFSRVPFTFFFYTRFYAVQAFYVSSAPDWRDYYNEVAQELLNRQEEDGSWVSSNEGGIIPPTAMAVFALSVPRAVLPIIQRE